MRDEHHPCGTAHARPRRRAARAAGRPATAALAVAAACGSLALLPAAQAANPAPGAEGGKPPSADGGKPPGADGGKPPGAVGEYGDGWVKPDQRLAVRLTAPVGGALRVFVGTLDVSALVRRPEASLLLVEPAGPVLPAGEAPLRIFAVQGSHWQPVAELPLKVLTEGGFEKAVTEPRLSLDVKSRAAEGRSADAPPAERGLYADLGGKAALSATFERAGTSTELTFNAGGSSHRAQALRFGELGARAPKVDLEDYRVEWRAEGRSATLGHLSYGSHPLLLDGWASRGLGATVSLMRGLDLSLSATNGSAIAGSDNLLGLDEAGHRVLGATVGLELLPERPGGLRVELSLLHASVRAEAGFGAGEVPDAQRSRGLGLRLLGKDRSGRLRADLALARSTFRNTADPQLEAAGPLSPMPDQTRNGLIGELAWDLLSGSPLLSARHPLKLTVQWRREHVEPLYRSLGASLTSDLLADRIGLVGAIAGAQLELQHHRREDNLSRIPSLLKTGDRSWELRATLPLPAWMGADKPDPHWPTLKLTRRWHTQRALNAPPPEQSGLSASQRPDQANATLELGAAWAAPAWTASWTLSHADQDNRQVGRERADTASLAQRLSVTRQLGERLSLNGGGSLSRQHNAEQGLTRRRGSLLLGADWRLDERWTLGGSAGAQRARDSRDSARSDGWSLQGQVARSFELPWFGSRPLPVQVFARYAGVVERQRNGSFGVSSTVRHWGLDTGLSISVF